VTPVTLNNAAVSMLPGVSFEWHMRYFDKKNQIWRERRCTRMTRLVDTEFNMEFLRDYARQVREFIALYQNPADEEEATATLRMRTMSYVNGGKYVTGETLTIMCSRRVMRMVRNNFKMMDGK
jgi:hypothetical protein